jgi:type I restriction enzyme R subunit
MSKYNVVIEMTNATVVAEYEPEKKRSDAYQSEAALENEFIRMLTEQGYEYLKINDSAALVNNLRTQLELLNDYKFTENEWTRFFNNNIANNNEGIVEKTERYKKTIFKC